MTRDGKLIQKKGKKCRKRLQQEHFEVQKLHQASKKSTGLKQINKSRLCTFVVEIMLEINVFQKKNFAC